MKRGRGRPPKTPTYSSKILNSGRRGSHHGGAQSPRVTSPHGVKTRDANRSTQRKHYFEGIQFSESDSDSDSSYGSSVSSVVSSVRSYRSNTQLRVIPMRSVTPLKLPLSSDDIILPPDHVLQALSIYEVLRQFGRILRLSPFRYEDFCAAIDSAEQSVLLSQIHMALFRALLLEDETNGYTFAASDEKDSLNIFLHEVDCFTWPEHIRSYFFSDQPEFGDLFDLVCGHRDVENPFPFVSIEDRLKVLKRLCDLFLASNTVREVIINEGITESEDHCRNCCKMGDLLCCENCPAVYHLHCLKPPLEMVPDGDWLCPICDDHRLKGVTDCHNDWTKDGWLRHTPLGLDREGRKYWFLSRRLFVESDYETVRYYSSKTHFDELIGHLEADGQERRLLSTLKNKYNTIIRHMAITESLVEASRGNMTSGLLSRRKDIEVKKSSESTIDSQTKEDTKAKTEVSLTFVPDTAVAKIVTKGTQESLPPPEMDKRMMAMKAKEESKKEQEKMLIDNSLSIEKDEDSSIVTGQGNKQSITVRKEVIDVSCKTDVTMDSQSPTTTKTDSSPTQKSEQTNSHKISVDTSVDLLLSSKETSNIDSPVCVTSGSASGAALISSVRKVIDFGSSETIDITSKDVVPDHQGIVKKSEDLDKQILDLESTETLKQESELDKPELPKDKPDPQLVKPEVQIFKPVTQLIKVETNQVQTVPQLIKPESELDRQDQQLVKPESELNKHDHAELVKPDLKPVKPEQEETKPEVQPEKPEPKGPFFRLGMEGNFTAYVNQFAANPLALNKNQHMEYKERKRAVHNKFSVEHEFKISGEIFGPKDVILNTLRCSIVNLENNIPAAFMHPIWPLQRSTWVRAVHMATTPVEFGAALIFLESLIKPLCFIPVWHDALGHLELHRAIVETKAEKAARKREHRDDEEEVEVQNRAIVNYSWIPMHQIWKQKGEEYRIFKGGGWTWHSGMSTRKRKRCLTKDKRTFECKKRKLTKTVEDFVNKRDAKKKEAERRAIAKLAVQAYKDKMKGTSVQAVTQTTTVTQVSASGGISVRQGTASVGSTVTQGTASVGTTVTQRTASAGTTVMQGTGVGTTVTQVGANVSTTITQGSTRVGTTVTQGTVSVTQGTASAVTSVTQGTASVGTAVTQGSASKMNISTLLQPMSGENKVTVAPVTQSTRMTPITHSSSVTQTPQSIAVNQVANNVTQIPAIPNVTLAGQVPNLCHSKTIVTQSTTIASKAPQILVPIVTQSVPMVSRIQPAVTPNIATAMLPTSVPAVTQPNVTQSTFVTGSKVTQSLANSIVAKTTLVDVVQPKNSQEVTQRTSTEPNVTQLNVTPLDCVVQAASLVTQSQITLQSPSTNLQTEITSQRTNIFTVPSPNIRTVTPEVTLSTSDVTLSSTKATPLITEVTTPMTAVTDSSSEDTTSSAKVTPSITEVTPSVKEVTPSAKEVAPLTKEVTPSTTLSQTVTSVMQSSIPSINNDINAKTTDNQSNADNIVENVGMSITRPMNNSLDSVDKMDMDSSTSEEVLSTKPETINNISSESNSKNTNSSSLDSKETMKHSTQDGKSVPGLDCSHEIVEEDDWVIIESKSNKLKACSNHIDPSKPTRNEPNSEDCQLSSHAVSLTELPSNVEKESRKEGVFVNDINLDKSASNIAKEPGTKRSEEVSANTMPYISENQSTEIVNTIARDLSETASDIVKESYQRSAEKEVEESDKNAKRVDCQVMSTATAVSTVSDTTLVVSQVTVPSTASLATLSHPCTVKDTSTALLSPSMSSSSHIQNVTQASSLNLPIQTTSAVILGTSAPGASPLSAVSSASSASLLGVAATTLSTSLLASSSSTPPNQSTSPETLLSMPSTSYITSTSSSVSSQNLLASSQPLLLNVGTQPLVTTSLITPIVTPVVSLHSVASNPTTSSQDRPVVTQATSLPVVTQATSLPVVTQATSLPVVTQATSLPVVTQATSLPVVTQATLLPVVIQAPVPLPPSSITSIPSRSSTPCINVGASSVTQFPASGVILPGITTTVSPSSTLTVPLPSSSVIPVSVPSTSLPMNTIGASALTQLPGSGVTLPGITTVSPSCTTTVPLHASSVNPMSLPSTSLPVNTIGASSVTQFPASGVTLPGITTTVPPSTTSAVPVSTSLLAKAKSAILSGQTSNVTTQDSLGISLTKTLISTAMKASQGVPVGSGVSPIMVTPTPKVSPQQIVKMVVSSASGVRPQPIAVKPTQQLRTIAPQPRLPLIQPGQKPLLQTAPQAAPINFPVLTGNALQAGGVVKISAPIGATPGTPVDNIAALVASLPGNGGTPGQTQLIRFVTPSGQTFTVQGTIQAGPGVSGATTINVPRSLFTKAPTMVKPTVVAPKTIATTTARSTVTIPRPQQPVVPKVTKPLPEKKEKYPVLEPLVKDPRGLLDRVISKWRKNRCSVKSVFNLKKHERRVLGRRAGMREVPEFMYVSRGSGINWPASFPRPSFKVAWRYRSHSLRTLAGAGLQARILHACLRWEDINIRPPRSNSSTICTSTGTTSSEVINHRYVTPDGLKCEYLVRKIVRTMKKPTPDHSRPPPPTVSKRGRTLRPKINLLPDDEDEEQVIHTGPRVFETWSPESELELWEVRQYSERKERERALEREKRLQEEAARRAAELRAAAIQRRAQEQQAKQQQQLLKKKVQNAIKTQQKKSTGTNQAVRSVYKPITMATLSSTGITSAQVIRPTTVAKQPVPRITNIVTQYRPTTLTQARVPIGTPATGMIRTVSRAQSNYRPLATTTTQAKTSTPVTPAKKTVSTIPIAARSSLTNAPKMKHSSKELQQAKQIAKAKGRKVGGAGLGQAAGKKHVSLETRQDMNRMAVCRKLMDHLIHKIERNEELERNKESKRMVLAQKQQRAKATKLDAILYKRKELLKKDIIRKRAVLEKELTIKIQKEGKKEEDTNTKKRKRESSLGAAGEFPLDKKQRTDELYCICRKPYDPTLFYIGCDLCANWFHGVCVGVTPEAAASLDHFTCSECSKAQQGMETEELYCLCRQPYDEAKFYIGCDTCHDWFHGICVNISEFEAEHLDSYICPRCTESQSSRDVQPLSSKDYDSLKRLLRSLQSHKMAWPFLEAVSADDVPGYYAVIKDPMDLSQVEDRLSSKYYNTVEQFNVDITTMFDNCRLFNPKESPYYRCAEVLEGFFVKKLRAWQKKT